LDWQFNNEQCAIALAVGVISASLCLLVVLFLGIMRQVFNRIRDVVNMRTPLDGMIVTAVLGGLLVGTVSWALPLTIGDGSLGTSAAIRLTFEQLKHTDDDVSVSAGRMTAHLLVCSMFAKMFTLAVSLNCGFAGGFVFPMLTIGTFAGCCMALFYPSLPVGFCIGAFMAAVPAGICPMPFTLLGIAVYCFYFGIYQTVPIFIAVITSYTVVCGSGLFRVLADRGNAAAEERKSKLAGESANGLHWAIAVGAGAGDSDRSVYVPPPPVAANPILRDSLNEGLM